MSVFIFYMLPLPPDPDDLVDAAYIAARTGLSEQSILKGKAGTKQIPVAIRKPRRWRRGDVDLWLQSFAPKPQPKPAKLSLVRRSGARA